MIKVTRTDWKLWLLFLILIFCLSGCAGGVRLFETKVRIDRLNPPQYATDVPLNQVVSFRVRPPKAYVSIDIWYRDSQGRRRSAYYRRYVQEKSDEKRYHLEFSQYLQSHTRYEIRIEAEARGLDDAYVSYWFETGNCIK